MSATTSGASSGISGASATGPVSSSSRVASIVKTEVRSDGVCVLTIDDPAETLNTITPAFSGELALAHETALADPRVRAIVLRSGKKDSFVVGANIDFVRAIRFARDAEEAAREVALRFARLGASAKPVVAWVHGPALGGGFELALACTASIASDDPKTVLGLPEVKLGLVPAANGLFRVADRAGLAVALDLGMTGRNLRPNRAKRLGLVDDVVPSAIGLETACALSLRLAAGEDGLHQRLAKDRRGGAAKLLERAILEKNPIGRALVLRKVRRAAFEKTRGHYPAADRIVDLVERFGAAGFRAGADLEPKVFGDLAVSETAHRLIDLFFAQTALKKDAGLESNEKAAPASALRIAVLGAGLMGAGIATVSAQAGLTVRLKDTDDAAIGRGLKSIHDALGERVRRGGTTALERDAILARVSAATDYTGLKNADVVIEAVFEDLDLKHKVLCDVEKLVTADCVIASNTSSIPIMRIAEALTRPERVVGMHYFSPVTKMPLLEVVRTKISDPRAIATAVALGKKQGKTVIVVRDGPGFYTTRILVPYLNEAAHLVQEGASIEDVDAALVDWGFPVGPFQLLDDVGIDVAVHVGGVTESAFGERMRPPGAFAALAGDDRKGRKNGRGFYLYAADRTKKTKNRAKRSVDPTVYAVLGVAPPAKAIAHEEIALRASLAMINEAARCLGDGIVRSARDADIGAIFGIGFPPFRGGPLRHVDVLGSSEILRCLRSLEDRHGVRFAPAPLLVDLARSAKRFYA